MAQNNNIVVYALMPAGGAQQAPPTCQTYHLPPFALVEEFSHRRADRCNINDHKLTMGGPLHPKNKPLPEYVCWPDAVTDQMLAMGYISDKAHFPDTEFQQIVAGMRRLKPREMNSPLRPQPITGVVCRRLTRQFCNRLRTVGRS